MKNSAPATGAVTSGDTLYFATVQSDPSGRLRLIKSRSGELVLRGRDQLSLRMFTRFLLNFLQTKRINSLTYIHSPAAGPQMGGPESYKVEALLQLMPCDVHLLPSVALTAFMKRPGVCAPGADRERLQKHAANMQERAIYAALYEPPAPKALSSRITNAQLPQALLPADPPAVVAAPARCREKPPKAVDKQDNDDLAAMMEAMYR